jgi:vitamin B12/bleomycin/antimicrobial peptide transport system ATP-binding/permease protein
MTKDEDSEGKAPANLPETAIGDPPSDDVGAGDPARDPPPVPEPPDDWTEDDDPEGAKRRYLLRRFWHSAGRFWLKGGDRLAWPLSAAVLALILVNLAFQYGINVWNRVIFDALEKRDSGTVFFLSAIFVS